MFASQNRLSRSSDIQRVIRSGARFITPHFRIYWQSSKTSKPQTGGQPARIAIVVSKKTAKSAVARNRIKRRTKVAIKSLNLPSNLDCVFFPNEKVLSLPFPLIEKEVGIWEKRLK